MKNKNQVVYQVFLAIFCIINTHLSSVQSLSCKFGFGISEHGSHELKTYFDNTVTANNCGTSSASNPSSEPRECMKNVIKLSGGILFIEYDCFTGTTKATKVQYVNYFDKDYHLSTVHIIK
ncbi:hypothetical protein BpHYR1_042710 [Brachionus plicatilis]|uniref:Uncharacterized protein n=1 Tax=Brachionus plicatilis TaxID=10195 RepID=A0A3M7Q2A2_BRAPC|nr:hypothetical protein BpHYR1_042710 [Brachionus plicatilis]